MAEQAPRTQHELEHALAEAEERYSDLALRMDNAQMLANMGDYDWHIPTDSNTWSDQLYRIYGHEPQSFAMSYETFLGFIHPEDQGWIKQLHERAYATGEPYAMTERIVGQRVVRPPSARMSTRAL